MSDISLFPQTGPSAAIELFTNYKFDGAAGKNASMFRAKGGNLYIYNFAAYHRFKFPIYHVEKTAAVKLRNRWGNSVIFDMTINATGETFTDLVLVNKKSPIKGFEKPNTEFYVGEIELESISSANETWPKL